MWLPMLSKGGPGRIRISAEGRTGHPWWTGGTFHVHVKQVWTVPHDAGLIAKSAAKDGSTPASPNLLSPVYLPNIRLRSKADAA